jgi:CRISPR/Cas system CSM-associated protein Csm3 (group 7 of RAMP superfamily)
MKGIRRRITYQGRLRWPDGFHTGDGRRLGVTDQPVLREEDGAVALAGTSLAGVLRADLLRLLRECAPEPFPAGRHEEDCRCPICRLLGPEARKARRPGQEGGSQLRASRLRVTGGRGEPVVRVRDHVGIDRRTRAAAHRRKYDAEVVEGGFEVPFALRIDDPDPDELRYLEAGLKRLAQGWLFLGGKSAGGLGHAELVELDRFELAVDSPRQLVEHLLGEDPEAGCVRRVLLGREDRSWAESWELPAAGQAAGWAQLRIGLALELPWGFLVNSPPDAAMAGFDHGFARQPEGAPRLPGSALRGALRSRAEQILRTFGGGAAACDLNRPKGSCHERIEQERQAGSGAPCFDQELAAHCLACRVFGSGRYASPVKLTDFRATDGRCGEPRGQEFVAIDRFTGGAAPHLKFDAQRCDGPVLAGDLFVELGPDRLAPWGLGLLALVLRDLLLGDIPLGFGTARGFNEYRARITGAEAFWLHEPEALAGLAASESLPGRRRWQPAGGQDLATPAGLAAAAGEPFARCVESWVAALHLRMAELEPTADGGASRTADGGAPPAAAGGTRAETDSGEPPGEDGGAVPAAGGEAAPESEEERR